MRVFLTAVIVAIAAIFSVAAPRAESTAAGSADATAIFAGGCFWCVEADFEKLDGVGDVVSGYTGGELENATYRNHGDHVEAARIHYDSSVVSYRALVDFFFRHVDPLDAGGQFCDRGHSYTTAIFVANAEERAIAEAAKADAEAALGETIVTPIRDAGPFWIAEDYHQDYYKKNPRRYAYYRSGCGRDRRIEQVWGGH